MAKKFKVTVKHFLNKQIALEKAEANADLVYFYKQDFSYPLYAQVIVKRQNTKFRSPGIGIYKQAYPLSDFTQTLFEKEKLFIQQVIGLLDPYENPFFSIAGIAEVIRIASTPIDQLFNQHLKKKYREETLSRNQDQSIHELIGITDWKDTDIDQIQSVYKNVLPGIFDTVDYNFFTVAYQCVKNYTLQQKDVSEMTLLNYIIQKRQNDFLDQLPDLTSKYFIPPFNDNRFLKKATDRILDQLTLTVFEAYLHILGISSAGWPDFKSEDELEEGIKVAVRNGASGVSFFGGLNENKLNAIERANKTLGI